MYLIWPPLCVPSPDFRIISRGLSRDRLQVLIKSDFQFVFGGSERAALFIRITAGVDPVRAVGFYG